MSIPRSHKRPARAAAGPFSGLHGPALQCVLRRFMVLSLAAIVLAWAGTQAQAQVPVPGGAASGLGVAPVPAAAAAQASPGVGSAGANTDYRVSRGDELSLRFHFTPELNTNATVRSDGRISLPLLGEVAVEGFTVAELAAMVERLLAPQVKRAQVSINVQGSATLRVFVGGEVTKPGMQPLVGPLTVLQAVMVAEGMKDTARTEQVLLLRRTVQGTRQVLPVDLDAVMSGKDPDADIALQPFDVVVVPRSGIANVGRWVDLYLRRTLPVSFGFNYTIDRNGSTTR